ncbi:hypothetical protein FA95DRAFT_1613943 [Auriscalpium vulgare]|uniref:Uncharacterized protein n=1 Tax=Auriscalpium vulgare TaxID=40419 RepID=A0ACB8R0W5_9AGAM|nr:hypothetical protein FA95DRAFT_1613943 [Auriscalpium vulgare]
MAPRTEKSRVSPRVGGNTKQPSTPVPPPHVEQVGSPAEDAPVQAPAVAVEPPGLDMAPGPSNAHATYPPDGGMGGGSAQTSLTEIEDALDGSEDGTSATSRLEKCYTPRCLAW